MDDWEFREARKEDWPVVAALLMEADLPLDGAEEHLAAFILVERAGAVVGCAGLEGYGDAALLRSVVVAPVARGCGLGRILVRRLLERAAAGGVKTVALLTTTAAGFFPRFGFQAVARQAMPPAMLASIEYRSACPASATVMVLHMDHTLI